MSVRRPRMLLLSSLAPMVVVVMVLHVQVGGRLLLLGVRQRRVEAGAGGGSGHMGLSADGAGAVDVVDAARLAQRTADVEQGTEKGD